MNLEESDRTIGLPDPSLVLLVGPRGAGKTTFARRHFDASEIVSFEECRRMLGDSGSSPSSDALELFQTIVQNRLFAGKLVVVEMDDTNVELRRSIVTLARRHHLFAIAIALKIDERICVARNAARQDAIVSPYEVKRGFEAARKLIENHGREGIRELHVLDSPRAVDEAIVKRLTLWTDKRDDSGPFDIIGDVHGCADELEALLEMLGYRVSWNAAFPHGVQIVPPKGRRVIFLGDLIDRGPRIVDSLRIAMSMVESGAALCVPGNHEVKFLKKLRGKTVSITHGLAETVVEFERMPQSFHDEVGCFIEKLVGHYVLDSGRLCVVHAGIKENMQGRSSSAAREFGLYGDTTGETDDYGLPVRAEWANEYHGRATVVYGHTPMLTAEWLNNTICIDTGCVFGGALTALRYPEREIISVPAAKRYFEPKKPLVARVSQAGPMDERPSADGLSLDLLRAGGIIKSRFRHDVALPEESRIMAAIELQSRLGIDPRWLVYIPPNHASVDPSNRPGTLEYPAEAFRYYERKGLKEVVCQEKRQGRRVVVSICRDIHTARRVFGSSDERMGVVYTRTGRSVFTDESIEKQWLERCRIACEKAKLFDTYGPFIIFEARLSVPLERPAYVPDEPGFSAAMEAIGRASARGVDMGDLGIRLQQRQDILSRGATIQSKSFDLDKLNLTPLQMLATDELSWFTRSYEAHAAVFERLAAADSELFSIAAKCIVRLGDAESELQGIRVWEDWTSQGADGMIVKPMVFEHVTRPGLVLPGLSCRGVSALRRDHGPEFEREKNLEILRNRSLSALRVRALGQWALGLESVEKFVEREPLSQRHACVIVALALEGTMSEETS